MTLQLIVLICLLNIPRPQVNDVAITFLPDSPYDENGMQKPTIAVGTAGGVSVIKDDGSVVNITAVQVPAISKVGFLYGGTYIAFAQANDTAYYELALPTTTLSSGGYYSSIAGIMMYYQSSIPPLKSTAANKHFTNHVLYDANGLIKLVANPTTPASGMVAYMTSQYNTGYMVGDIRGCWLSGITTSFGEATTDRSVKAVNLTAVGVGLGFTPVGSDLGGVYGFNANNYLTMPNNVNWNTLHMGDNTISLWLRGPANSVASTRNVFDMTSSHASNGIRLNVTTSSGATYANSLNLSFVTSGGVVDSGTSGMPNAIITSKWAHIVITVNAGSLTMWFNGNIVYTAIVPGNIIASTAPLEIGKTNITSNDLHISLLRLSATASTPEQIAAMYALTMIWFMA